MNESSIFPKGEKAGNEKFTGTAWFKMLVTDEEFNCPVYNVTFEPGARTKWHKHPGGQILLVTDGEGYYQEYGKPKQLLKKGNVVKIPPNVKHWHGARKDNWFVHIGITANPQKGEIEWLGSVTDEEYEGKLI